MKRTKSKFTRYCQYIPFYILLSGAPIYMVACNYSENEEPGIRTLETIQTENRIEEYKKSPSDATKQDVEASLATLDQEIAELEARVDRSSGPDKAKAEMKLKELKERRSELGTDFTQAKLEALIKDVKESVR